MRNQLGPDEASVFYPCLVMLVLWLGSMAGSRDSGEAGPRHRLSLLLGATLVLLVWIDGGAGWAAGAALVAWGLVHLTRHGQRLGFARRSGGDALALLRADPLSRRGHRQLIEALAAQGRFQEAHAAAVRWSSRDPFHLDAWRCECRLARQAAAQAGRSRLGRAA